MKHNAEAGVALGLHGQRDVESLLERADRAFRREVAEALADGRAEPGPDEVCRQITALRFPDRLVLPTVPAFGACRLGDPEPCETGFSEPSAPDLRKTRVATVMPLHRLKSLMSVDDRKRMEDSERLRKAGVRLVLPNGPADRVPDANVEALRSLSHSERSFRLAPRSSGGHYPIRLGEGVLWFTTAAEIKRLRQLVAARDEEADRVRDGLGLVRREAGMWLVLITFPGYVIQARGHYRPVFCDSGGYERFMAGSSHPRRRKRSPWGQTADLNPIERAGAILPAGFDGARERVVPELDDAHFPPGTRARFELIGKLRLSRRNDHASHDEFSNRLAERNKQP